MEYRIKKTAKHGSSDNNTLKSALATMGRCFEVAKAHASANQAEFRKANIRDM